MRLGQHDVILWRLVECVYISLLFVQAEEEARRNRLMRDMAQLRLQVRRSSLMLLSGLWCMWCMDQHVQPSPLAQCCKINMMEILMTFFYGLHCIY